MGTMRFTTFLLAASSALTMALPTTLVEGVNTATPVKVGCACDGNGLTGVCVDLHETKPNKCMTSISGELTLDRSISSLELQANRTCAFFKLESCIAPPGGDTDKALIVIGPKSISQVPQVMQDSIQAYICGPAAMKFVPANASLVSGMVIADVAPEPYIVSVSASVNASAAAQPSNTSSSVVPSATSAMSAGANAGGAATIYKGQNYSGESTQIPSDPTVGGFCRDLSVFFGSWEHAVRSVQVTPGWTCAVFQSEGCAGDNKKVFTGSVPTLPSGWDQNITSVRCQQIVSP